MYFQIFWMWENAFLHFFSFREKPKTLKNYPVCWKYRGQRKMLNDTLEMQSHSECRKTMRRMIRFLQKINAMRRKDGGGSVMDFGTYQLNGICGLWSLILINYKKTFIGRLAGGLKLWLLDDIKKLSFFKYGNCVVVVCFTQSFSGSDLSWSV